MGTHTGHYFGFKVSGDKPFFKKDGKREEEIFWQEFLVRQAGIPFPRNLKRETEASFRARHDRFMQRWSAVIDGFGCELIHGGWDDYPEYFVAVKFPREDRGFESSIHTLDVDKLVSVRGDRELRARLKRFCAALGLRYRKPAWHIVLSHYDD